MRSVSASVGSSCHVSDHASLVNIVVDASPSRKKTKGGVNVFQYAGTVEKADWNDEQQKQQLEVRHPRSCALAFVSKPFLVETHLPSIPRVPAQEA